MFLLIALEYTIEQHVGLTDLAGVDSSICSSLHRDRPDVLRFMP